MNDDKTTLARCAVACPGWRRMERMRLINGKGRSWTVLRVDADDDYTFGWSERHHGGMVPAGALPDLDDPATLGCLLALVREAHKDPDLYVEIYYTVLGERRCAIDGEGWSAKGPTEVEALVAAIEAASARSRRA